jgi:hypothetical protein
MYTDCVGTKIAGVLCRTATCLVAILTLAPILRERAIASDEVEAAISRVPLSTDEVVNNLVRRNAERSRNLFHSEAIRVYHLSYCGFPGNLEAEMTVEASYDSPATKEFKVLSQSGPKIILDLVFKKLLEGEKESIQPQNSSQTQLNRENYDFALLSYDTAGDQYVLQVSPKRRSKFVYRGQIWVDGKDFAVTRIEAEPAQSPSFWTKRSEIHHEYEKIQDFWLPVRNRSISYIRLGGRATLTIEYKNYHLGVGR